LLDSLLQEGFHPEFNRIVGGVHLKLIFRGN